MKPFTLSHLPSRTIEHEGDALERRQVGRGRRAVHQEQHRGAVEVGVARRQQNGLLPQHPRMQALLADGVARYGLHFGSSRNGNLQLAIYDEVERKLGELTSGFALTVSSGMVAGQVVVDWLAKQLEPNAIVLQAPGTHPALWHPLLKPKTLPLDTQSLAAALDPTDRAPLYILTNSVDALRGLRYDFSWLRTILNRRVWVIVDDSHGLGVLDGGRGIYKELMEWTQHNMPNVRCVVTASLAKAMGLPGGVILGDSELISTLRQTAYFGACSPMPPAYAYAFVNADAFTPAVPSLPESVRRTGPGTLYQEAHERLMRNVALAESLLMPTGLFTHDAGYPVFYTDHDELYPTLLKQSIFIYSFAYPTAADKANTRIIISAYHEEDDIKKLADAVQRTAGRLGR